ncbi:uncharacterized protein [Taeniopygia guttata]|uniref:uncharacterized protein isoform X7 n=1 Tax=Taeniopygia guttata TaxID=59729 RepID=UPI003BB933A0
MSQSELVIFAPVLLTRETGTGLLACKACARCLCEQFPAERSLITDSPKSTTSLLILKCILYGHHSARILKTCLCLCGEEFIQPQKAQWVYSVRYRKMSSLQTPVFLEVDFSAEVKWVNIRQLIIETCMLHSQSRMTEQVMDDLKQDFSYWTCFGQGAVFLSVLQALMPVRCYIDSQWIGVMDVKGDINQAVVKDLTPPLVNGDKCHPESSPLWDRNPTERSPENMPDTSYSIRRPIKR